MPETAGPEFSPDPFLRLRVGDVRCKAPVFVPVSATVAEAARAMAAAGATAALATEADETVGILTERDVLVRVVAAGQDPEAMPVGRAITRRLITAQGAELLIEAFSRMVRHSVRRLVLLDDAGRPAGILGEGEMLSARGESPLALAAEIAAARDEPALRQAFARLANLAARSVAEGIGQVAVGRLISEMHDRIMAGAWELALSELGPAPCAHCVLVLGSQGRREQFLATDQDLALIFEDPAEAVWFEELGRRLTRILLAAGFPPCSHGIMLDNAQWRKSRGAWLDLLGQIADRPDAEDVVRASLLADMRPLASRMAGDPELGGELRAAMLARFRQSPVLLKFMAREAVRFDPPLGLFGQFSLKKDALGAGVLDLKRGGVFPITQGAKTLALDHGLDDTGTCQRLRGLAGAEALSVSLAEGLCEAYEYLQTLRMRAQAADLRQGRPTGNDIRPDGLSPLEQGRLRGAFKLTAEFQGILFDKYGLRLFS